MLTSSGRVTQLSLCNSVVLILPTVTYGTQLLCKVNMDLKIPGVWFVSCKNTSGSVYLQDTNNPWENTRTHTILSDPNVHWNSNFLLPSSPSSATAQMGPRPPHCWGLSLSLSHAHAHTHTYTHSPPVRLLWTNAQPVAEASTYTTHSKHTRRTSIPSAGFEPAIPFIKRLQTYALDVTVTGIGRQVYQSPFL
jgi:hypothetical protein